MGNAITANVNLDHELYHQQDAIEAGRNLLGKVIIQVQETLKPCDLTIEVNGKEKTTALQDGKIIHDKHCFFRADVQLFNAGKPIQANTYVFPFSIPLPKSLPASRNYEDSRGSFRIEYNLKLKTQARGKFPNKRSFEIVSSLRVGESVPCLLQPKPTTTEALGMSGKGKIFLGAHVKDTNVLRGRDLLFSLACRNESTLKIDRAVVALEEEYYYTTKTFGGHGASKIFERDDLKRLPGIRVVGLHTSEFDSRTIDEETIARRMFKDLKSKGNIISLTIPESSKESYSGIIVQVSHYLRFYVIAKTDSEMYPSIRIPIRIGSEHPGTKDIINYGIDHVSETARIKFPLAKAQPDAIVLGRNAGVLDNDESFSMPIPLPDNAKPTMTILREELAATIDDFDFMSEKMKDLDWAIFFASLTAEEFGSIIALVGSEFAQPRVAVLLAQNFGGDFTCAHCAAAIRNVAPVFRSNVVEGLLPFCTDLPVNNHLIREQLSDFEQIIVALHALNEDEAPEDDDFQRERSTSSRRRTVEEVPAEMKVPTDILVGIDDLDEYMEKPPSDMTLETALRQCEVEGISSSSNNQSRTKNIVPTGVSPRRLDVLLGVADHPQTFKLISAIKAVVDEGEFPEFCPPAFRLIKQQFSSDQRFLVAPSRENPAYLREATKLELIEHVGNIFDRFKAEKIYEDLDKAGSHPSDEGCRLHRRADSTNWREALEKTHSEWELALTVHTYASAIDNGMDPICKADGGPSKIDICFFKAAHPGNAVLVNTIRQIIEKKPEVAWSPPLYRAIKKSLTGRRFFVSVGEGAWCEATQVERRENVEKYFQLEKDHIAAAMEKSRHSNGRDVSPGKKAVSSRRRSESMEESGTRLAGDRLGSNKVGLSQGRDPDKSGHRRISLADVNASDRLARSSSLRQSFSENVSPRVPKKRTSKISVGEVAASPRNPRESTDGKPGKVPSKAESSSREGSERLQRRSFLTSYDESGHSRSSRSPGRYQRTKVPASPSGLDKSKSRVINKESDGGGGSERQSRRSLLGISSGSGHVRRSKSAGKYKNSDVLSPQETLEKEKSRLRSYNEGKPLRDQAKESTKGVSKRKSNDKLPVKSIEILRSDEGDKDFDGSFSANGEMALNDTQEEEQSEKGPGFFRRFTRKNSIRTIETRNMRHPRDLDICYGSASHPGTIALVEAVVKSMHKLGSKGWSPNVYKAIRLEIQGRRFFVRADRESPWREASPEEQLESTQKLFEAKRRERNR